MKTEKMKELIEMYIKGKVGAWASSTLDSERHRLLGLACTLSGNPDALWSTLSARGLGAYTVRTTWIRVTDFWQWCLDRELLSGPNRYRVYKEEKAKRFKDVYQTAIPEMSFQEALARIQKLPKESHRKAARALLTGGLRVSELATLSEGRVVGKGGKSRRVYCDDNIQPVHPATLRRALSAVGLKPHFLRKLCASALARQGLSEPDLLKAMGWNSMETAKRYLQPLRDEELAQKFRALQGGNDETQPLPERIPDRRKAS